MKTLWPLQMLPQRWMLYRLPGDASWPRQALAAPWAFLSRTPDEVTLLLPEEVPAPEGSRAQGPWRGLRVAATLDFDLVGVLAGITHPLAEAGVSVLALATFDTDYLFVPADQWETALAALRRAGYPLLEAKDD